MLSERDLQAFAEDLYYQYGSMADLHALKRAKDSAAQGDGRNRDLWYQILDRVRELQTQEAHISEN